MKTLFSKTVIVAMTFLAGLFLPGKILAQPFPITNHLTCPIDVKIDVFQQGVQGGHIGPCYLASSAATTIPPGGTFPFFITLPPSYSLCDIVITVTTVGGMGIPPLSAGFPAPASGPGAACAPWLTINVTPTGADIH